MGSVLDTSASDAVLVQAAQAGDAGAFDLLVARHRPGLVALCVQRVGSPEVAEDLAQEALVRVWRQLALLRHPFAFGAWARRIATNLATSHLRRRGVAGRQQTHLDQASFEAIADEAGAARTRAAQASRDLAAALARVPAGEAQLLRWHFVDDRSQAEIAARLGVHPSTVCRRIDQALERLRRQLDADGARHSGRASRVVPMAVALGALSSGAWANAGTASVASGGSGWAGWLAAERVLTSLLQGWALMSTANKIAAATVAVAVAAGGYYAVDTLQTSNQPPLVAEVASQVDSARPTATLTHVLGSETTFALAEGQSLNLSPGPNPYAITDVAVARGGDDVSAQITFANGTTRVFRGGLSAGDFVMLGATNYVEDGEVEGSATEMPPGLMIYLTWDKAPDGSAQFRVFTRSNEAFGRELMGLKVAFEAGQLSNAQVATNSLRLMHQYQMWPAGEAWRRAGAGFVP